MEHIEKLNAVLKHIKTSFVGKDEIIDLLGISLIARENAFLLGPPGTAKSAIIRALSACISDGKNFEYLLTRFTEPGELFGPFDIRKLKEGDLVTNTEGMMPEASMVFLDEIFNANSAILNSLLTALNERIFRRGKETKKLPALMFIGASNVLPEDESLNALLDRFLIRARCDYVDTDLLEEVLVAGWNLETRNQNQKPAIAPAEIIELQQYAKQVDVSTVRRQYVDLIHNLRNTGIKISDRRAVKIQNLLAASAVMSNRKEVIPSDLWVLKHVWDTEEQIEILEGIINTIIEKDTNPLAHPQAQYNKTPNAEELIKEIIQLTEKWESGNLSFEEQNVVKDKLRYLQTRSNWIKNNEHKLHIQEKIESLWHKMLQTI
ncbi:AAA family ATPase [Cytophaga hutchinsonii]|uniref:Possible ATPase n=1 Tax=Cytophaga hutchinsonii (strain ATCC 33406 / DSM 1761 / CIP 103989 / NBRC 15051 / NCIMB 9469 / D465) TaxID=269798 RepID=A0A6N4SRE6_CYTH3|nr:AAA family ATPase [Cytophaga hutchinsonii]ABG58963.1 possible ATPase [Cytophaga hutchinsonii ATCC 33406]SFX82877.1 MoxR-like ATPase [Cytophaga hutchinsonii ATCC 33406]